MSKMTWNAKWIRPSVDPGDVCPEFFTAFDAGKPVRSALLRVTALGVYAAHCNGKRIGRFVLAPGWTSYETRLQVQTYDVTDLVRQGANELAVTVGKGWYCSPMAGWMPDDTPGKAGRAARKRGLTAELTLTYEDGTKKTIVTDDTWRWRESPVRFSEIYDGETYDARMEDIVEKRVDTRPETCNGLGVDAQPNASGQGPAETKFAAASAGSVVCFDGPTDALIPQEGEEIREQERVCAARIFTTPAGETLVDFGQEVTGYVEFTVDAHAGEQVIFDHGEVLDKDGNFYNENYRSAKARVCYTCREGLQTWHPQLTFFGFRYIRLLSFLGQLTPEQEEGDRAPQKLPSPEQFRAVVVYSDLKRTGSVVTGHAKLNQLISNIFWGQRGNFLDVPTDCPQRDERLGWTGDAQVFVKAASLNFDVERFFRKWLRDLAADQRPDGGVGQVIPDYLEVGLPSAAWGDAAVICPWQIYQTYGGKEVLREQFPSMKAWVDYITSATKDEYLWTGGTHFGDWLGLDAPSGSYKGSSRDDLIASAFYAYSTELLVKTGELLGYDVTEYRSLHGKIREAFRSAFPQYQTQTEHVVALQFGLAVRPQQTADDLAEMVRRDGCMKTGFVGTPYLLHVLAEYGHADLAWDLLLREPYPSWLYPVDHGATTVWEHWDGIMEDGSFWSADMNSFNHYAYGSVMDWIYEKAAGITHAEEDAGFTKAVIAPCPDARLGFLDATLETRNGRIRSAWRMEGGRIRYEIETEMPALIRIGGRSQEVKPGRYVFWE